MDFQKLFAELGRGFGIVQAMHTVTRQIEAIRRRVAEGMLTEDQSLQEEEEWLQRLNEFYLDPRWQEIDKAKRENRIDDAQRLAKELRSEYGL
jgi:regulator of replication initiation timing